MTVTEFPQPLRLAKGSHQPGSGKGCAMNVISYINGDTKITDYPGCSAKPLAHMVQTVNDRMAGPDGFLSPEDSVRALDLAWRTVGTADAPESVGWQWLHDLLVDETYGVVRYARADGVDAIREVADLLGRKARGEEVRREEIVKAAYAAAVANDAYASAVANYVSLGVSDYVDVYAAACATTVDYVDATELVEWAITRWRELQGLDVSTSIAVKDVELAVERIGVTFAVA